MADPTELRVEPARVGQVIGGKYPVAVACPKCHLPAWKKDETTFVHSAVIYLNVRNNPELKVHVSCTHGVKEKGKR